MREGQGGRGREGGREERREGGGKGGGSRRVEDQSKYCTPLHTFAFAVHT